MIISKWNKNSTDINGHLSQRSINLLKRMSLLKRRGDDFEDEESIKIRIKSYLENKSVKQIREENPHIPYGVKIHLEIYKWLGLPNPEIKKTKKCPHCGGIL